MKQQKVNIWDLDGTVINSFKRVQPHLNDAGDLDLNGYMNIACTHENIMTDTLLPLVQLMKESIERGEKNYIVTARQTSKSDYYFLRKQGLRGRGKNSVQMFSRSTLARHLELDAVKNAYYSRDAEYKQQYFNVIRDRHPNATITVFDDHDGVLNTAASMGFRAVDAKIINDLLDLLVKIAGDDILSDHEADLSDVQYLSECLDMAMQEQPAEYIDHLSYKVA